MSTLYFAREVLPHMQKRQWGRLIAITSLTVKQPVAELVYSNAVRAAVASAARPACAATGPAPWRRGRSLPAAKAERRRRGLA